MRIAMAEKDLFYSLPEDMGLHVWQVNERFDMHESTPMGDGPMRDGICIEDFPMDTVFVTINGHFVRKRKFYNLKRLTTWDMITPSGRVTNHRLFGYNGRANTTYSEVVRFYDIHEVYNHTCPY